MNQNIPANIKSKVRKLAELAKKLHQSRNFSITPFTTIKYLLIIEKAINCVLSPDNSAYWGYQIASDYAEQYHPDCFEKLNSKSAPMLAEIVDFWSQYYGNQSLPELVNRPPKLINKTKKS